MEKETKERLKNIKNLTISSVIASLIFSAGYTGYNNFVVNKDYGYNIYNNKELKISEEEQNELVSLLESESGISNIDNERDLILTAAINNPNLNENEKQMIYSLVDLIEDNPYINKKTAYANLRDLDIIPNAERKDVDECTVGRYIPQNNTIELYEEDVDNNILRHELVHCIFYNSHTFIVPRYLSEGVTELLIDEYFTEEPFVEDSSYPYEIAMVKILCEMIGSDAVLEAYSTGDLRILYNKLCEVMDKKSALKYLDLINDMFEDYNRNGKVSLDDMSEFLATTNAYFSIKEGNTVNEAYEYNKELLINMKNDNSSNDYIFYVINNGYYKKPYFSSKLKEETKKNYLETDSSDVFEKILKQ